MKILEIEVKDVRGAPDGMYRFGTSDAPAHVSLVTGAGPCGKTSLLEAVVAAKELAAPYGVMPPSQRFLRRGASRARVAGRWLLDEAEQSFLAAAPDVARPEAESGPVEPVVAFAVDIDAHTAEAPEARRYKALFSRYDRSASVAKLEYFDVERRMRPQFWNEPPALIAARMEGALRLGFDLTKYAFVRRHLGDVYASQAEKLAELLASQGVITEADNLDVLAPLKKALATLSPDLRLARVELAEGGATRIWFARRNGQQVELEDLSASEHQAVLFAVTFLRQGLARSIVLVDGPERDIPRSRQLDFFKAIVALAPDGQIVAATESPEILAGMSGAHVIDLAGA